MTKIMKIFLSDMYTILLQNIYLLHCFMIWHLQNTETGVSLQNMTVKIKLNQRFLVVKFKSSHHKFSSHNDDLVNCYGISVSEMTIDMFLFVVITISS